MPTVLRRNRKATDDQIVRLNIVGLSLGSIGEELELHATSVSLRLKKLKIPVVDTRRAFMEDIWNELPQNYRQEAIDLLMPDALNTPKTIKGYVKDLLVADLDMRRQPEAISAAAAANVNEPPEEPVLQHA